MKLEEFKGKSREILSESLEGRIHESLEDILSEVLKDYERFENYNDSGEWEKKYKDLKEKYVSRFINGENDDDKKQMKKETVEKRDTEEYLKKDDEEKIKTIDDLFKYKED